MAAGHNHVPPLAISLLPPPPPPPPSLLHGQQSTASAALPHQAPPTTSTLPTPAALPHSPESPDLSVSPSASSLASLASSNVTKPLSTDEEVHHRCDFGYPSQLEPRHADGTHNPSSHDMGIFLEEERLGPDLSRLGDFPDASLPSPEWPSDHTPLLQEPGPGLPEDFRRSIKIIKSSGGHETTHVAQLLVDTGSEENLIARALVDHLRLKSCRIKAPFGTRLFAKLFFWTRSAKDLKAEKLRAVDGAVVRGQDSKVTIRWSGDNNPSIRNPVITFRPTTFTTTHLVVDNCVADVVLSWNEARNQGLRTPYAGASGYYPKPPTAEKSKSSHVRCPKVWDDYAARKAQKDADRRQGRGHATDQSSDKSGPSSTQPQ
ncbi:uncharacterized protein BKCO1_4700068 [Diplodia corticola]|uniref:Uncharacterized protein n=1 Tax=Diplodia corticola TaxID=236234 RepID=A0A1J9RG34_9PEZI|nr:uncharacterized protein BKCO1_4700068 [Diplodia corticola]OJD31507.1 hypothetical protein BKCO1_4700068 [Diplodia corticola]